MVDQHRPRHKLGKPAGDNPQLIEIGAEFAARRREMGVLQQDLADQAGVSRSTLHTIEHGGTGVRWEKITAVASALGLEMKFLPKEER
ncbi:helix-turn-helix domain-containing protein [Corynebacterium camporealensis]|uniref:Helix-turn-helix domain n=1 Tax=Corynebacterium camporealensis TaxID=161896 RepID=A0A0F6T9M1_9CORY|nr:helix-turn-helix domain-containing protein [Corynebacterium camporealensis]AKE38266.1 Helix-turn-helix domain [Corynebacterium camporealensis]